jgi:endonuclease/exonuclease/phosphatase (EEP) superfamily protein YafD
MILIAVPAAGVAVGSLLGFFGRWSWELDLLANFRPQYVLALTVLGLALLAGRWRKTAAAVLGAALANAVVVAPLFLPAAKDEGADLRIVSFNLRADNRRFAEVVDYLRSVDADLVVLHEASRRWEMALGSAGLDYVITRTREDGTTFATMILAPPDAQVRSFGFDLDEPRAVEVVLGEVSVLAIHPLSPVSERRAFLHDRQLAFAAEWAAAQPGPAIVTGDLNATPWAYSFRQLLASTNLRNSLRGFGLQPSFPSVGSVLLRLPIDHLLHTPDLNVVDRRLGPRLGSDHFPLVVDLGMAAR